MNSLQDPKIASQLDYLHEQALGDEQRWAARREEQSKETGTSHSDEPDPLIRMGEFYIPVTREEGEFLYLLARAKNAEHIVEFGASFGISTLYLAAAARDCGGKVTTTEIHPGKCDALRASFATAGVEPEVRLLEGDAQQTLKEIEAPIDILFLDGWKSLYLPVFELLQPLLSSGALIAADNVTFKETQPYLDRVQAPNSGLITQIIGDLALSCVTG
jgi:predicted O-methyltransferase YrrM